ncbi:hypothetical protein Tco_0584079 [Tanacetum coccineum]
MISISVHRGDFRTQEEKKDRAKYRAILFFNKTNSMSFTWKQRLPLPKGDSGRIPVTSINSADAPFESSRDSQERLYIMDRTDEGGYR